MMHVYEAILRQLGNISHAETNSARVYMHAQQIGARVLGRQGVETHTVQSTATLCSVKKDCNKKQLHKILK